MLYSTYKFMTASCLHTSVSHDTIEEDRMKVLKGDYQLIYFTPEQLILNKT